MDVNLGYSREDSMHIPAHPDGGSGFIWESKLFCWFEFFSFFFGKIILLLFYLGIARNPIRYASFKDFSGNILF